MCEGRTWGDRNNILQYRKKKRTTEAEGKERKERGGMELRQVMALTPHPHLAPQRAKQIQQAQTKERDEPLWWDCGRPAL